MSNDPAGQRKTRSTKGLGLHDFNSDGKMDIYLANRDGSGPSLGLDGEVRKPRGLVVQKPLQRIQQFSAAEAAEGEALVRRVHDAVTVQVCFQIDS